MNNTRFKTLIHLFLEEGPKDILSHILKNYFSDEELISTYTAIYPTNVQKFILTVIDNRLWNCYGIFLSLHVTEAYNDASVKYLYKNVTSYSGLDLPISCMAREMNFALKYKNKEAFSVLTKNSTDELIESHLIDCIMYFDRPEYITSDITGVDLTECINNQYGIFCKLIGTNSRRLLRWYLESNHNTREKTNINWIALIRPSVEIETLDVLYEFLEFNEVMIGSCICSDIEKIKWIASKGRLPRKYHVHPEIFKDKDLFRNINWLADNGASFGLGIISYILRTINNREEILQYELHPKLKTEKRLSHYFNSFASLGDDKFGLCLLRKGEYMINYIEGFFDLEFFDNEIHEKENCHFILDDGRQCPLKVEMGILCEDHWNIDLGW